MSQIDPKQVNGLVRTETQKGDQNADKPYTALMNDGSRVQLDASTARSLEKRLDKDRSRMEREGTRAPEREREQRGPSRTASKEAQQQFLRQFRRSQ